MTDTLWIVAILAFVLGLVGLRDQFAEIWRDAWARAEGADARHAGSETARASHAAGAARGAGLDGT